MFGQNIVFVQLYTIYGRFFLVHVENRVDDYDQYLISLLHIYQWIY
jgi:hypothetical protein